MRSSCFLPLALIASAPAGATSVSFAGTVVNLCVLTVSTPGLLGTSGTGTTLASTETGGVKAILAVVATGTNPTLNFSAPALAGPAGSIGGAVTSIAYTSPGGGAQSYTSAASSYSSTRLIDTLTIDARAVNANGFVSGAYAVSTTVTCQQ